jgi:uncharacterized membrane protein YhaH (DUF805 family)
MKWMFLPLKRYADFSGRSRPLEYWMFALGITIVATALIVLLMAGTDFSPDSSGAVSGLTRLSLALIVIFALGIIVPSLAVQVRRFHDQDKSGWFVLLGFIPYIGGLITLVFMCLPGTRGPNRFGDDPLDPAGEAHLGDVFG